MGGYAWVTLATNDSYSLGALVLAHSLQRVGSKHDLAVLITPGVTGPMREKLASVFNLVQEVNVLDSKDEANLALLARPELGITFTKLHCWRLTQYEKCVFIDADALVVRNCDELFEREELSAAPDVGWPDCFNSGVFVFKPSQQTFVSLTTFAASQGSFDGGDQGLLNSFFSDWAHKDISKHLPFIYNMCSTATYSYLPAFKQFGDGVKIIHFIGVAKPWLQYYDTMTGIVQPPPGTNHLQPLLQMWWNIFCDSVHPHLDPSMPLAMATRCRDSQSNFSCEATTTLAPNWHEFFSFSPNPNVCVSTPPYHNSHDNYCDDDVRKDPDFSEFKDPWDDYQDPVLEHFPCEVSESVHSEQYYTPINERLRESPLQAQDDFVENFHKENLSEEQMFGRSEQDHNFVPFQEDHHNQETESCHQHQHSQIAHPIQNPHHLEHEYHHKDSSISDTESHCDTQLVDDVTQTDDSDENFYHPHSSSSYSSVNMGTDEVDFHDEHPGTSKQHSPDPTKPCASPTSVAPQSQSHVRMSLEHEDTGLAGALSQLTLGQSRTPEQNAYEEQMRKQNWEQGYMDYMGRDSFDNIWKKICETLSKPMEEKTPPAKEKPLQEKAPSELSSDGAAAAAETEAPGTLKPSEAQSTLTDEANVSTTDA